MTFKKSTFLHVVLKRLSMSPEVTLGDNYIFAVFDLIFYYCHQDWANNAL